MRRLVEFVGNIDWNVFVQRVVWSVPLTVLVMLACVLVFRMSDSVGEKKIDYVYASEEQKDVMKKRRRLVRKRVLVCVFWFTLTFSYVLQYAVDYMVTGGGM